MLRSIESRKLVFNALDNKILVSSALKRAIKPRRMGWPTRSR